MKPSVPLLLSIAAFAFAGCATQRAEPPLLGDVFAARRVPTAQFPTGNPQAFPICAKPVWGSFACYARVRSNARATEGYAPGDLQSAYRLPSSTAGNGSLVAVVDAYDDPRAEADMGVYRTRYRLGACTTANGCFRKVNESGASSHYPRADRGWSGEISLDLDMVSAICPHCSILLVEATSNTASDLGFSVEEAARLGAQVISNSYGGLEYSAYDPHFDQHGRAIVVAGSGDSGYFPEQPATFSTVVAVGGTTLTRASNARGWDERVWNDADIGATGSGCSDFVAKPPWQSDDGCPTRAEADVAAVADPLTGVLVYDSLPLGLNRKGGWVVMGGTSVATPIVAAVYGLAGNGSARSSTFAESIYFAAKTAALNHVDKGQNGDCPTVYAYICDAGKGYNGPTGWGTPNGIAAF